VQHLGASGLDRSECSTTGDVERREPVTERGERGDKYAPRESAVDAAATENTDVVEIETNGEEA
jgi:hypothetical protein